MNPAESLVVVKLDPYSAPVRLIVEVLELMGLWADVGGPEMDGPGVLRFRVPREQMMAVALALDCHGVTDVKAYEGYPAHHDPD